MFLICVGARSHVGTSILHCSMRYAIEYRDTRKDLDWEQNKILFPLLFSVPEMSLPVLFVVSFFAPFSLRHMQILPDTS